MAPAGDMLSYTLPLKLAAPLLLIAAAAKTPLTVIVENYFLRVLLPKLCICEQVLAPEELLDHRCPEQLVQRIGHMYVRTAVSKYGSYLSLYQMRH